MTSESDYAIHPVTKITDIHDITEVVVVADDTHRYTAHIPLTGNEYTVLNEYELEYETTQEKKTFRMGDGFSEYCIVILNGVITLYFS